MISPAPPTAREPRCTRCQSVALPSSELYWHIGDTPMRFRMVTPRSVNGSNKFGIADPFSPLVHLVAGSRTKHAVRFLPAVRSDKLLHILISSQSAPQPSAVVQPALRRGCRAELSLPRGRNRGQKGGRDGRTCREERDCGGCEEHQARLRGGQEVCGWAVTVRPLSGDRKRGAAAPEYSSCKQPLKGRLLARSTDTAVL